MVGERLTYCRWNEHESPEGLLYASYIPVNKKTEHNIVLLYLHGSSSRGSSYAVMRLQSLPRVVQETENFPFHGGLSSVPFENRVVKAKDVE